MSKNSFSRDKFEKEEGKPEIKNQVPDNKYQANQQVAETMDSNDVEAAKSSFLPKHTEAKGSEVKMQKVSEMITGSANNPGMGIQASGRSVSGTMGGILGANNSTPQAGQARSNSRVGKKLDRIATKLNFTPCETALLKVDESKPLAESRDKDQGYNGTYRNETARSQKIMGAVPADLMYQRSVDFIEKDQLYFVEGQMVFPEGDNRLGYFPTRTLNIEATAESNDDQPVYDDVEYHIGNYMNRAMHIQYDDRDNELEYFYCDVEDLTPQVNQEDANVSSAHRLIKSNVTELDRSVMDTKAGDEKADIWCPIPRATDEPEQTVSILATYEAETGAYAHLAYSKATTSMAFELNRGPKDGLDEVTPAVDALCGYRYGVTDSDDILGTEFNNLAQVIESVDSYRAGDASLLIAAYDSPRKYTTKADLLLQPRGLRMHLQTADNNMNPLHVPTEYANFYSANEAYSTIDHEYDSLLPICMTDKANLITAHNVNETTAFARFAEHYALHFEGGTAVNLKTRPVKLFKMACADALGHELIVCYTREDLQGDDLELESTIDADGNVHISIESETVLGTTSENFDVFVCTDSDDIPEGAETLCVISASGDNGNACVYFDVPIVGEVQVTASDFTSDERIVHYRAHGGRFVYSYSDLRNNYNVIVKHPLYEGILEYIRDSIGTTFNRLLKGNELYVPMIFSTRYLTLAQFLICAATPWILRVRKNSMRDVIYYEDNVGSYPFSKLSSLREIPFKKYVNFEYSDYDSPLVTKIMNPILAIKWCMPEFFWHVADGYVVLPWYFNQNEFDRLAQVSDDASCISFPSIRSGIRLGILDNFYGMEEKDIRLSLDRMTKTLLRTNKRDHVYVYKYGRSTDGQIVFEMQDGEELTMEDILSCPRELGLGMECPMGLLTVDPAVGSLEPITNDGTRTSFRIYTYTNRRTPVDPDILDAMTVNIDRSANFVQKYYVLYANGSDADTQITGLVFGLNDGEEEFSPFATVGNGSSAQINVRVRSCQRSFNTRLQFLPFIISPFDSHANSGRNGDIYDLAYIFGLCGFRASDYRESVYNREKEVINQGPLFVEDPWVIASPQMKEGSVSTGIQVSQGYEIK